MLFKATQFVGICCSRPKKLMHLERILPKLIDKASVEETSISDCLICESVLYNLLCNNNLQGRY